MGAGNGKHDIFFEKVITVSCNMKFNLLKFILWYNRLIIHQM